MSLPDKIKEAAEKEYPLRPMPTSYPSPIIENGNYFIKEAIRPAFIKGASFLLPEIERRAIKFMEFRMKNYTKRQGGYVHRGSSNIIKPITVAELYKIFDEQFEKNR